MDKEEFYSIGRGSLNLNGKFYYGLDYAITDFMKNMEQEKQQLKEQLQQRDEVIEETAKLINSWRVKPTSYFEGLRGSIMAPKEKVDKLLDILNKYKGDSNDKIN